jgi:hypothetical protein
MYCEEMNVGAVRACPAAALQPSSHDKNKLTFLMMSSSCLPGIVMYYAAGAVINTRMVSEVQTIVCLAERAVRHIARGQNIPCSLTLSLSFSLPLPPPPLCCYSS